MVWIGIIVNYQFLCIILQASVTKSQSERQKNVSEVYCEAKLNFGFKSKIPLQLAQWGVITTMRRTWAAIHSAKENKAQHNAEVNHRIVIVIVILLSIDCPSGSGSGSGMALLFLVSIIKMNTEYDYKASLGKSIIRIQYKII